MLFRSHSVGRIVTPMSKECGNRSAQRDPRRGPLPRLPSSALRNPVILFERHPAGGAPAHRPVGRHRRASRRGGMRWARAAGGTRGSGPRARCPVCAGPNGYGTRTQVSLLRFRPTPGVTSPVSFVSQPRPLLHSRDGPAHSMRGGGQLRRMARLGVRSAGDQCETDRQDT